MEQSFVRLTILLDLGDNESVKHIISFGEVSTDMERRDILVAATDYLADDEVQARKDWVGHVKTFKQWQRVELVLMDWQ